MAPILKSMCAWWKSENCLPGTDDMCYGDEFGKMEIIKNENRPYVVAISIMVFHTSDSDLLMICEISFMDCNFNLKNKNQEHRKIKKKKKKDVCQSGSLW